MASSSPRIFLDSNLRIPPVSPSLLESGEEEKGKTNKFKTLTSLVLNAKLSMHVAGTHASVVGQDAHEAGSEVAGLVVGVQELDVPLNGRGGGMGGSDKTEKEGGRECQEMDGIWTSGE